MWHCGVCRLYCGMQRSNTAGSALWALAATPRRWKRHLWIEDHNQAWLALTFGLLGWRRAVAPARADPGRPGRRRRRACRCRRRGRCSARSDHPSGQGDAGGIARSALHSGDQPARRRGGELTDSPAQLIVLPALEDRLVGPSADHLYSNLVATAGLRHGPDLLPSGNDGACYHVGQCSLRRDTHHCTTGLGAVSGEAR